MRGCGRGGAFAESDEGGDECVGVEGEGPLRRVTREETNAWVWKGRGLCGELVIKGRRLCGCGRGGA